MSREPALHCQKYGNFTLFPIVKILKKGTVPAYFWSIRRNYAETMPLHKICTSGN